MKRFFEACLLGVGLIAMGFSHGLSAVDPRDSVILESKTFKPVTRSPAATLRVYITNKDSLKALVVALVEKTLTGSAYMTLGRPRTDTGTAGAVVRLASTLRGMTILASNRYDSATPDSFTVASFYQPGDMASIEPPNVTRKAFLEIRFDTVKTDSGRIVLDSATILVGQTGFVNMRNLDVKVNFVKGMITVDPTPPSVTVIDPNGDDALGAPCPYAITWTATDNAGVTSVQIRLDRTNDGIFEQLIANLNSNPGSYNWIPGTPTSSHAKIKVIANDAAGNTASDVSDAPFSIVSLCVGKLNANFDLNQDGVIGLADVVLYLNAVQPDADESFVNMSREFANGLLAAIFAGEP